jgi:hypothetical protein
MEEKDIVPDASGTYHLAHYLLPGDDPSIVLRRVVRAARDAGGGTIALPPGEYSLPDPAVLGDVDLRGGLGRTVVVFDEPLRPGGLSPDEPPHHPPGHEAGPVDARNHLHLVQSSL